MHINNLPYNVNGLNTLVKEEIGHVDKSSPIICCLQETHFKYNDIGRLTKNGKKKSGNHL